MRTILIAIACVLCTSAALADPSPYTVDFTQDEAQLLVNLLDSAVKQGGLPAAEKALPISTKLLAAGRSAQAKDKAAADKAIADKALADKAAADKPK